MTRGTTRRNPPTMPGVADARSLPPRVIGSTRRRAGQGFAEYALIIGIVAVVTLAALIQLSSRVDRSLSKTGVLLTSTAAGGPGESGEAAAPEAEPILSHLSEAFDGSGSTAWTLVGTGDWKIVDGVFQGGMNKGGENRAFVGDATWQDYRVTVKATLHKGNGYGVYFRATDAEAADAYIFQYDPGYAGGEFLFRRVQDGRESGPFARARAPDGFQWNGVERTIAVDVTGDTFTASVDGQVVMTARATEFEAGQIGLRTWDSTQVSVSSVTVTPLQAPTASPRVSEDPAEVQNWVESQLE